MGPYSSVTWARRHIQLIALSVPHMGVQSVDCNLNLARKETITRRNAHSDPARAPSAAFNQCAGCITSPYTVGRASWPVGISVYEPLLGTISLLDPEVMMHVRVVRSTHRVQRPEVAFEVLLLYPQLGTGSGLAQTLLWLLEPSEVMRPIGGHISRVELTC